MTTDITELAQRLKLEVHRAVSNFNPQMNIKTRDLKELVEALEKAQKRIASQREYYEGVIADGGKRIAELEESHAQVIQSRDHYKRMTEEGLKQLAEARTVNLPEPEQWDITQVLLCKKKVVAAIRAAGIKVEDE
ncbi:hypothetical protein [Klebsiella pneumoniae]|uniref:hypothetical protein n=1 Tax=Klebsiella pneumoniae TaxID=573 RepID=UPI003B5C5FC8